MTTKLLIICSGNTDRSPTAAALCRQYPYFDVRSAGTSLYAKTALTEELVLWADVLLVMENVHTEHIQTHYADAAQGKALYCLDIPDEFRSMDPALLHLLRERLKPVIERYSPKTAKGTSPRPAPGSRPADMQ